MQKKLILKRETIRILNQELQIIGGGEQPEAKLLSFIPPCLPNPGATVALSAFVSLAVSGLASASLSAAAATPESATSSAGTASSAVVSGIAGAVTSAIGSFVASVVIS